jgi:hypothetical protein
MSEHWRVALGYAAWILAGALVISGVIFLIFGAGQAWSFFYGAGTGVLSFLSTAVTISLFSGRSVAAGLMIGAVSFVVRLAFAAAVLGLPAYLGLWPVVPMLVAFAGVYAVENVAAMFRVAGARRGPAKPGKKNSAGERESRKVGS